MDLKDILFKGKRVDNGEWIEGNLIFEYDHKIKEACTFIVSQEMDFNCPDFKPYEVKVETVAQYTGRNDKNNKKIFVNDIVKLKSGGGLFNFGYKEFVGVVKFRYGGGVRSTICQFYIEALNDEHNEADFNPQNLEIVGNIYDNPEFLEV